MLLVSASCCFEDADLQTFRESTAHCATCRDFPRKSCILSIVQPGHAVQSTEISLKESEKSPKRSPAASGPGEPQSRTKSAPRSPKRVQNESEAAFLDSFRTAGRTLWGLWGSPGPEAEGHPFGLFLDSFGVPGPRRARETSVPGRGVPNLRHPAF